MYGKSIELFLVNGHADVINRNGYLPFARDPFGNYFCYNIVKGTVCFHDHEEDKIEDSDICFQAFTDLLH